MNDFKECYRSAVNDMLSTNEFHIDASQCMDERRHNRFVVRRMKRTMTTAFSAACVIFLCGFGTAKAAETNGDLNPQMPLQWPETKQRRPRRILFRKK